MALCSTASPGGRFRCSTSAESQQGEPCGDDPFGLSDATWRTCSGNAHALSDHVWQVAASLAAQAAGGTDAKDNQAAATKDVEPFSVIALCRQIPAVTAQPAPVIAAAGLCESPRKRRPVAHCRHPSFPERGEGSTAGTTGDGYSQGMEKADGQPKSGLLARPPSADARLEALVFLTSSWARIATRA